MRTHHGSCHCDCLGRVLTVIDLFLLRYVRTGLYKCREKKTTKIMQNVLKAMHFTVKTFFDLAICSCLWALLTRYPSYLVTFCVTTDTTY